MVFRIVQNQYLKMSACTENLSQKLAERVVGSSAPYYPHSHPTSSLACYPDTTNSSQQ